MMAADLVKQSDSEKITINVGYVDLGHIDLLVREGFYSNRTDLIRTAIRNQIASHADTLRQTVSRRSLVLGIHHYSRKDLEARSRAWRATSDPGSRSCEHCRRRHTRSGAEDDRIDRRIGHASR